MRGPSTLTCALQSMRACTHMHGIVDTCSMRRHLCLCLASLYLLTKLRKARLLLADALFAFFDNADK